MSSRPSSASAIHPQRRDNRFVRDISTLPNCRIFFLPSFCFSRSARELDRAGSDEFGKHHTDHACCDDGVMPLICPTCQMVSQDARPAGSRRLLCMGLFSIFLLPASGRTQSHYALAVEPSPQLSTFSAAMNASCGMSTLPNCRIFFLPSFCFSRSLRLRVMSPP
jgi:hypothetical protein